MIQILIIIGIAVVAVTVSLRAWPSITGAKPRVEGRKRDFSLPLAVPAKNSHPGVFCY